MFRKRRVATPGFGHTPWNPIQGEQANLRQEGTHPFCAMMQVAAEDTHKDYVICRGFDPRILKFIDYSEGDTNKPGISVAKPFGKRLTGKYQVGEVYPAFLPTQGNSDYTNFRQVTYTPPSPVAVKWRVGQNPGVVSGGGLDGGQPDNLTDEIQILRDENGKAINWLLIDSSRIRRNWVGFLYASYSGVVIGFWVVPTYALDGVLPDGPQWVVNEHKWNFGVAGATVRVEEDPVNNRWRPLQQDYICPDGRTVSPPPPPPPADPPVYPYPE